MGSVRFVVWSDYLCPWCYNASVRLTRLADEWDGCVELEWRSFLLRPAPRPAADAARFRAYTRSWLRPGAESDAGVFRVWAGSAAPPSHSVPAQRVAKAAADAGGFRALHERLLYAYFAENRDISDEVTLRSLWREAGLADAGFAAAWDAAALARVLGEHDAALAEGVTGVPAVRLEGRDALIVGAQPLALYRRWIERALDGRA